MRQQRPITKRINKRGPTAAKMAFSVSTDIPRYTDDGTPKIAIIQPASYGDNINSTLMLKPLRQKYPNAIIDVHTSTTYWSAFDNNPYLNHIIKHSSQDKNSALHLAVVLPDKLTESNYSIVFNPHPMINGGKWCSCQHPEWGENLIFAWVHALEEKNIEYSTPLETVLRLRPEEVDRVNHRMGSIAGFPHHRNILMEIHGESGQTVWDHNWTIQVGEYLLADSNTHLFISHRDSRGDIQSLQQRFHGRVHWVGDLTIRECAELFNHCQCFFSVSSGLSNACNTNWCKKDIRWVEVVNSLSCSSAAIRKEGKLYYHQTSINDFIDTLRSNSI